MSRRVKKLKLWKRSCVFRVVRFSVFALSIAALLFTRAACPCHLKLLGLRIREAFSLTTRINYALNLHAAVNNARSETSRDVLALHARGNVPGARNPFRALMLPVVSAGIIINNSTPPLAGRPKGGIAMRSEVGTPWKISDCGRCARSRARSAD